MKKLLGGSLIIIIATIMFSLPVNAVCSTHADGQHVFSSSEHTSHDYTYDGHREKLICSCGGWYYESLSYQKLAGCLACYCTHTSTYTTTESFHQTDKGHIKSMYCSSCNDRLSYSFVSLNTCSACNPSHTHSYYTYTSSSHSYIYNGHYQHKSCSCGSTVSLGYVTDYDCSICNPLLPTNQSEFEIYVTNHGKLTKISVNNTLHYVNYITWKDEGNVFAYGIPSSSLPLNNEKDINGSWRYLGYTESGNNFTNQSFLDDYSSGIIPENWYYLEVSGAQAIWNDLISAQKNYMNNEKLIGHGATSLYVNKLNLAISDVNVGESNALVQSAASWYDASSIRINHYYNSNPSLVYYATFNQPSMGGEDVQGLIETDSALDMGVLPYIDITINASSFIDKPDNEVENILVRLDNINNSYVTLTGGLSTSTNSNSTALSKIMRVNKPDVFPYTITLTGTATVNSIFGDFNTLALSRTITIEGVNETIYDEKPEIIFNPNSVSWTSEDVSVIISVTDNEAIKLWNYRISDDDGITWGAWSNDLTTPTGTIVFNTSGIYKIDAYAEDETGNSTTKVSGTYQIDKTPPSLFFGHTSGGYRNGNIIYAKKGDWVNFFAQGIDTGAGMRRLFLIARDNNTNPYRGHTVSGVETNYNTHTKVEFQNSSVLINTGVTFRAGFPVKIITQENNLVFEIEAIADDYSEPYNRTGWVNNGLRLITDNLKPSITFSETGEEFYNENIDVDIEISDWGSGYKSARYQITESPDKPSDNWNDTTESQFTLMLEDEGTWFIHIEALDNVNNYEYICIGDFTLLKTKLENFRITKIYDPDFININSHINVQDMAVFENFAGKGINLGYVLEFEIDSIGLDDINDKLEIEIDYYALLENGSYQHVDLYVKDNDYIWRNVESSINYKNECHLRTITSEKRFGSTWRFDYFIPWNAKIINKGQVLDIYDTDSFYTYKLLVLFRIKGYKDSGINYIYNENETLWGTGNGSQYGSNKISGMDMFGDGMGIGEVFYYILYKTVMDEIYIERVF